MTAITREALWARLRDAALVQGDLPALSEASSPWFVRVMLGFAGWIGALFLLGFVGVGLAFVVKSAGAAMVAGICACAGAALIFRVSRGDFAGQFGLAAALAGQALMAFALFEWFKSAGSGELAAALAVQQAVLFVLLPNYIHRVWAAFTAVLAAQFALGQMGFAAFVPATVTALFLVTWLYEFDHAGRGELWRPLGYGLALSAVQAAVLHGALWYGFLGFAGSRLAASQALGWAGAAASGGVLLWAVLALLRREGVLLSSGPARIALAAAAIVAAVSFKAPGVGPATAILVVGYANGNRVLAGLGIATLVGYLSQYYYSLHATLLEKSGLLVGAGLLLLAARLALHRWWPLRGEASRA